jgi:hypothetical protein
MKRKLSIRRAIVFLFLGCGSVFGLMSAEGESYVKVESVNFHGWEGSISIDNGRLKVVVVPEIGRIMFFGPPGGPNLLWTQSELFGERLPDTGPALENDQPVWLNFGGDKVWPTEESLFPAVNGRAWPPDHFFDGARFGATQLEDGVEITSPVSDYCGARLVRRIRLRRDRPELEIEQRILKVRDVPGTGLDPLPLTIWEVTQIRPPEVVLIPLVPAGATFEPVHVFPFEPRAQNNLKRFPGVAAFFPSSGFAQKVGTRGDLALAAVLGSHVIVQEFRREPGGDYPDEDLSVEVYSSPDYTEMELLSPQRRLRPGDSMTFAVSWKLMDLETPLDLVEEDLTRLWKRILDRVDDRGQAR